MNPELEPRTKVELLAENERLREHLAEAGEALRAIQAGEVDALVVGGEEGAEVRTLQGADHSYRTIFETMTEGVAVVTHEGMILSCNARLSALLKQPMEKLVGNNLRPFIAPADQEVFDLLLMRGNRIDRGEIVFRCADNSFVPVQLALNALNLRGTQGVCLVAADITDLKRTEERLLKSEERFKLLVEDVLEYVILALNEEGCVESWNLGAERVKGYRAAEILGRNFSVFYPPEDVQAGRPARILAIAREQGRFEEEGWRVRKDGSRFWAHVAITALRDKAGCLIGFSTVTRDITQQREADEALRRSEEIFHSALNYFPGGFGIHDAQNRFQYVNLQMPKIFGIPAEAFIGHTNEELFPPEITSRYLPALRRCVQERKVQIIETTLPVPGGPIDFVITFVPILNERGEILQTLGIGFDITERRRTEAQVEAALKKEVILRREIQHRVKNSLQIISSLLFLQSQELTDPKMIELLRESQARTRSIALVYSLLSQREEIASIEFGEYAKQLLGALSSAYERDKISFQIGESNILLDLDTAVPCGLIITELVSNALKYAFPEGRQGEIAVILQPEPEVTEGTGTSQVPPILLLTIRDNGIGLPHGFDLDAQSSLGLRLVRDLTQQIGGKIEFKTDQGTEVRIRFPCPRK